MSHYLSKKMFKKQVSFKNGDTMKIKLSANRSFILNGIFTIPQPNITITMSGCFNDFFNENVDLITIEHLRTSYVIINKAIKYINNDKYMVRNKKQTALIHVGNIKTIAFATIVLTEKYIYNTI